MIMKRYKLIIFDFDGTLVDTAPDIAFHANAVLKEFGLEAQSIEMVKKAVGRGIHELLKDLGIKADSATLERAVTSFKKRYRQLPVIETKPYPGIHEVLSGSLKNIRKAIVTNKPYELTAKILKLLSMESFFEMVIGLDMQYPAKPDPSSVRSVMDHFSVTPSSTLFIGDSSVDAETSRNASIDFGWAEYGYDRLDNGHRPVISFSNSYEWKILGLNAVN